jgi:protocatechuate 3,4-dioxygenase beta subunit
MQLCLRVIDHRCQALEGYLVEVWHCDPAGVYSGDTRMSPAAEGFATDFCTGGAEAARESTWYRGQRRADAEGRVNFKSHFPGWYPGRTAHIHFAISDPSGQARAVSQLCFPDALADEIYRDHPLYRARGAQDTSLEADGVFARVDRAALLSETERQPDGTLLAYHTVQVDLRA